MRSWSNLPSFFVGEYPPSLGIVALKSRCHMPRRMGKTQGKNSWAPYGTLMGKSSVNGDSNGKIICKSHLDGVETTSSSSSSMKFQADEPDWLAHVFDGLKWPTTYSISFRRKSTLLSRWIWGLKTRSTPPRWPLNRERNCTIHWSWGYFTHFLMDYKENLYHYTIRNIFTITNP